MLKATWYYGIGSSSACPASSHAARARPGTRVMGAPHEATIVASLDMAAERLRPAGLARRHHATLESSEAGAMPAPISVTVAAEDVPSLPAPGTSRLLRTAAPPPGAGGRAGSACRGSCWSPPAYTVLWC